MFGIFSGDFLAPLVFHSLMIILHVQNDFWNLWTCRVVKKTTSNYPTMRIFARRVSAWTLEPRVLHFQNTGNFFKNLPNATPSCRSGMIDQPQAKKNESRKEKCKNAKTRFRLCCLPNILFDSSRFLRVCGNTKSPDCKGIDIDSLCHLL